MSRCLQCNGPTYLYDRYCVDCKTLVLSDKLHDVVDEDCLVRSLSKWNRETVIPPSKEWPFKVTIITHPDGSGSIRGRVPF
jgi:hypothetical protein